MDKKYIIIGIIAALLVFTMYKKTGYQYQEDFDQLIDTGGNWDPSYPASNAYDGDWNTQADCEDPDYGCFIEMAYNWPAGYDKYNIDWKLAYTTDGAIHVNIPLECTSQDRLYLRIAHNKDLLKWEYQCRTTSGYTTIHTSWYNLGPYEEGITWRLDDPVVIFRTESLNYDYLTTISYNSECDGTELVSYEINGGGETDICSKYQLLLTDLPGSFTEYGRSCTDSPRLYWDSIFQEYVICCETTGYPIVRFAEHSVGTESSTSTDPDREVMCGTQCSGLRQTALQAIFDWIQGGNKQVALDAILLWASNC